MTARRPVRVTIEGEAYRPAGADNVLMVVRPDGGKVCLTEGPGVTVEDIVPPRTWTDGDVVQHQWGWIGWRERGVWWTTAQAKGGTANSSGPYADDAKITDMLGDGLQVIRYQAGEDQ